MQGLSPLANVILNYLAKKKACGHDSYNLMGWAEESSKKIIVRYIHHF